MSFQDNLPDLEISARIFDDRKSNYPPSPVKQKAKEIYLKDFCLTKRPSRVFNDDVFVNFTNKHSTKDLFKPFKNFPSIFNDQEPVQEKELGKVNFAETEHDLKPNQLSPETQEPLPKNSFRIKIKKPKPQPVENKPKKEEPKIEKPKRPERKKSADELNNLPKFHAKYSDYVKERQGKINNKKRNKKNLYNLKDPPQLRAKVSKVYSFWNGKTSFIPQVFRVIDFKKDRRGKLLEYLDYSLKGLSHEYGEFTEMRREEE